MGNVYLPDLIGWIYQRPFSLARYGDGEWAAILGQDGQTCDGQPYTPELVADLRLTIEQPKNYFYGMLPVARCVFDSLIDQHLDKLENKAQWVNGAVFSDAAQRGELYPLIKYFEHLPLIYVGPPDLAVLCSHFNINDYIYVPSKNAHADKERIKNELQHAIQSDSVVGFSCGPLANVLIYELWQPGLTLIDFGSVWDGIFGQPKRNYQKTEQWPQIAAKNRSGKNLD